MKGTSEMNSTNRIIQVLIEHWPIFLFIALQTAAAIVAIVAYKE